MLNLKQRRRHDKRPYFDAQAVRQLCEAHCFRTLNWK